MLNVKLLSYTADADKLVASAAKLCYAKSDIETLMDKQTPEKVAYFVNYLSELGHESPIEHATYTFGIEGVSRSLLAQITRHRIASYSVQSQRYVDKSDFEYVMPPSVAEIPEARAEFEAAMSEDARHYDNIKRILTAHYADQNKKDGMNDKDALFSAEKKANEDARFVLPNACDTRIIMTMNARSLLNFFAQRGCNRAQWEIRELAYAMYTLVSAVSPLIFAKAGPSCVRGSCSEGAYTCRKAAEVRGRWDAGTRGRGDAGTRGCGDADAFEKA
jgi:thymidylate synthase (FAD)